MKIHTKASELVVEESIAETLKHAPNKPGGTRYKVEFNHIQVYIILFLSPLSLTLALREHLLPSEAWW